MSSLSGKPHNDCTNLLLDVRPSSNLQKFPSGCFRGECLLAIGQHMVRKNYPALCIPSVEVQEMEAVRRLFLGHANLQTTLSDQTACSTPILASQSGLHRPQAAKAFVDTFVVPKSG